MDEFEALALAAAAKKRQQVNPAAQYAARNQALANQAGLTVDPTERAAATDNANAIAEQGLAQAQMGRPAAAMVKAAQGGTFGFNDELLGAVFGDEAKQTARTLQERADTAYPAQSTLAEVGGAMLVPGAAIASPAKAVALGAGGGMLYAAGEAEGGVGKRVDAAIEAAPESILFSALGVAAQRGLSKAVVRLSKGVQAKPTASRLRALRDQAYKAVDDSGVVFTKDQFDDALTKIYSKLEAPDSAYVKGDAKVERALRVVEKNWGRDLTLGQLDNVRKRLMKTWASAAPDEAEAILDIVDGIDELIDGSGADPVMRAAREAHKTYMRVDFLEKAFQKAENATSSAGSGGNIYNNYVRVFKNILADDRKSRIFTPEMREFMQAAIDAPVSEKLTRKLGKLSPDGNGLMLALSVIGGSLEPSTLTAFGAGAGAKVISDRKMAAKVDDMMRLAAGLPFPAKTTTPTQVGTVSAIAGQQD